MNKTDINKKCRKCNYCKTASKYMLGGELETIYLCCTYSPYMGEWVGEIEKCPRDGKEGDNE